ncbi:pentatricopeptide repeat-containing protein At4g01030, mitochondrial-like [Chenopodium quinoa]|uniref:DYW domain-containing protein n=1 Tax=Chenopodium quinoa TaxID=63459 RepID=A0A803M4V7_CHEQI|nr:pentatricopeptide repeat-containing protein At4g01030, mitochondrial-like [Chenopodium quinoa]
MEKLAAITTTSNTFTSPVLQTPSSFWKLPRINSYNLQLPLVSDYFDDPGKINSITLVNQLHAQVIKLPQMGHSDEISQVLITSYLKFQDFESALMVFFRGFGRNFVVWKSFLEEFKSFGGNPVEILEGFCELHGKGVEFDSKILTVVLKICAILMSKWLGVEIHASLIKRGFDTDVYLKSALMNFYGRCWGTGYADKVFDEMPERGVALWNEAMVAAIQNENYMKALQYFQEMQFMSVKADNFTIGKALQACAKGRTIDEGRQIHGYMFRNYMEKDLAICNSLINMYAKNNKVELARKVFDSMDNYSLSSWNTMISAYASVGSFDDAMELFHRMEFHNVEPDIVTWNSLLSSHLQHGLYHQVLNILRNMLVAKLQPNSSSITPAIQAINELNWIKLGKEMHCYVLKNGFHCDLYVQTTLLNMYVKNGELIKARAFFDLMKTWNIVAWNSLISGYSSNGLFDDAVRLLNQMEEEDINPDIMTLNSLLSGYSLNGRIEDALAVVEKMEILGMEPNVVSWTALISGCSQNGKYKDSLSFFKKMVEEGINPNASTISSLLQASAGMSCLQKGKEIHSWCLRNRFDEDVLVATALMQMYIKSGSLQSASEIFRWMKNKTIATWNCMIMGYAAYNHGEEGIMLFKEMRDLGIHPDAITFTALLSCCKNSGLLDEGWKYFDSMKAEYCIVPTIEHYSCMVDLLGRAGYLDEAWDFIKTMPVEPDASVWGSLLQSCRVHNNLKLGKIAAKNLFELEPKNSANYVILMNLYTISSRWEDVDRVREEMTAQGLKIQFGWSWIEIYRKVHIFSEEKPHPDTGNIYFELYHLISEMKKAGYIPDIKSVYQDIDDADKEKVLLSHTEKLAITYGLLKMKDGSPIRVIKSTRMCSDCHTAAKFISVLRKREIILKDGVRFHHFQEGRCSCNDHW